MMKTAKLMTAWRGRYAAAAAVLLGIGMPGAASAQSEQARPRCTGFERALAEGGAPQLHVVCGGAGVLLGPVDQHTIADLPSLQSSVVVTRLNGTQRVWLLMPEDDRRIAVEEITNTIAREAGRGPRGNIDDLDVDLSQGGAGRLTAALRRSALQQGAAERRVSAAGTEIDLTAMVTRSRAIRAAGRQGQGR
ncbi:MAG: hypothetical protein DI636_10530 [Pelagerythrobacter marensis]|nr:MAG: hypothetical protein DI636_10530 [Pelagerythrobacter marensis]PZU13918.1 MAG: hypothetical protein DI591_12675 [Citromicrobium sp.]